MKNFKKFLFLTLFILIISSSYGYINSAQIKLLAVSELEEGVMKGSVADLYLDIKPGKGRVFIDTYPFTKLDTQFTTRYAKTLACNYADIDCSNYDFFYTIKAGSTIVGGPSAGAATTLLTLTMLKDEKLPDDISITGTISSGGIIGPVGGTVEKIIAASKKGINKVYISKIGINETEITNTSLHTEVNIVPVYNMDELYFDLFGKRLHEENPIFFPTENYVKVMTEVSENLCDFSKTVKESIVTNETNLLLINQGDALFNLSINETIYEDYYSAASYCFGASSKYQLQKVLFMNDSEINVLYSDVMSEYLLLLGEFESKKIESFTDLQTYMITSERLVEVSDALLDINLNNLTNRSKENLAYAFVRLKSAKYWAKFYGTEKNDDFLFDDSALLNSCYLKLSEVEGYLNYVNDYLNLPLSSTKDILEHAYSDYYKENYALCLFKSLKAKADTDLILSTLSIKNEDIQKLIDEKEKVALRSISSSTKNGVFPILAYSYYTYGQTLKESDFYSSLLYFEYASAMSDISIYFEKEKKPVSKILIPKEYYFIFSLGLFIGSFLTFALFNLFSKSTSKVPSHKKNRIKK